MKLTIEQLIALLQRHNPLALIEFAVSGDFDSGPTVLDKIGSLELRDYEADPMNSIGNLEVQTYRNKTVRVHLS